ncbi:MAG: MMPL family transporter, partial [Pseudomonadales bacterium]|nr:MMPL family transporter [Pseudomonadales bacterium]
MNESSPHFSPNLLSRLFKRWAELTYDNPVVFIVLCLALLGLSLSQALHIKMDMSTEAMLHKEDPARLNYDKFRQTFGREDAIILTLATEGLLSKPLLQQIANIHNKIETSVPHVAKVTSLVNARYTYGAEDELIVEDLLEGFPDYRWNDEELTTFVLAQPAYLNRLISADGEYTAIIVELQTFDMLDGQRVLLNEGANAASVAALKDLLADYTHLDLRLSGAPVMLTTLNDITSKSTQFTSFIGSMVVLILSYIFFRRISGVLFPILIVQTSILSALGVMGFFNAPFTLTTNAVLALMLGIAVADAVHILSLFYRYYEDHGDKRLAVVEAMSHSAPAVFLTTLTTAIGFLSFITGDLASTSELGIYAAVAVSFALFYTVTLLPSLIALCPIKRLKQTRKPNRYLTAYLTLCSYLTTTYPRVISLLTIVLLALCLWGASKTDFSYDPVAFFPDRAIEKAHYLTIDEQLAGLTNIEVVIDTGESDGIYNPEFIQKLTLAADTLSNTHIGERSMANSYSLLNILKETHKGLNGNQQAFYSVPESRELIAQEILLFEMSEADDLYDVVNDDKSMVRLSLKTRHADGVDLEILIRQLEQELAKIFANSATVNITGATVLVAESVP